MGKTNSNKGYEIGMNKSIPVTTLFLDIGGVML
jgi:hypothetical protein